VVGLGAVALAHLQAIEGITILGPVDCPLERLQNRWRRHILIKMPTTMPNQTIGDALAEVEQRGVQMVIDVDPFSLM
jgi:primosomal protein N' (replication factor Y) (superfamily II helicase)